MKKKYSKIPLYWQKQLAKKIFGSDDDCVMSVLSDINPEVNEEELTIKVETKNKLYLELKKCREKHETPASL